MNFNCPRIFHSALFLFFILLSVSGCGGGGGAGGTSSAPSFNGVAVAIPSAAGGEVTLSWDAATDDATASSAMVYDISVATTTGAPFAVTHTSAAGATSYTVSGLTDDTDYFFVVRARDAAGNRDTNSVEAVTHELMGTMNLRGATMFGAAGDIAFTYFDFCNTNTLDFGDGSSIVQNCPVDNSDVTVNHQYAAAGTYTVTMTESPSGNSEYITLTVTPVAKVGVAAHQVVISNSATGGGTWSGANPDVFTPNALGAKVAVTDIQSRLNAGTSVVINTSTAVGGNGDISVDNAVSWNTGALTLSAERDVIVNAVMTASGTSSLLLNSYSGTVRVGMNAGGFSGKVDFPGRTGAGILTIGGFPYTIINSLGSAGSTTAADLQGMNGGLAGYYALGSDIDAAATSGWNSGAGFDPVGTPGTPFTGQFNGLGHTISNLTINRGGQDEVGLFGRVYLSNAVVSNVGLVGGSVTGKSSTGGLVGYIAEGGLLSNCFNTGSVTGINGGIYIGGLVGQNYHTPIDNSFATGNVTGDYYAVGGLVGAQGSWRGVISNSFATGNVTCPGGSASDCGGLVGMNSDGGITGSYATGNVVVNNAQVGTSGGRAGGLVGINGGNGWIADSYATGSVSATNAANGGYAGGLVGWTSAAGGISNSYSTGSVTSTGPAGGLVGTNTGTGAISNSFWDTQTSGQATSAGGTGKTTTEMKAQASFTGWDFASRWKIIEGVSYPTLQIF
jgi:hypothetical protein